MDLSFQFKCRMTKMQKSTHNWLKETRRWVDLGVNDPESAFARFFLMPAGRRFRAGLLEN
jgi:hypothetical protein